MAPSGDRWLNPLRGARGPACAVCLDPHRTRAPTKADWLSAGAKHCTTEGAVPVAPRRVRRLSPIPSCFQSAPSSEVKSAGVQTMVRWPAKPSPPALEHPAIPPLALPVKKLRY